MRRRSSSESSAEVASPRPPATPRDHVADESPAHHEDPLAFSSPPAPPVDEELSPTQTLAASSPELPPLPPFPALARSGQDAADQLAEHARYYTASWGSPYQQIPHGFKDVSRARKGSLAGGSSDVDDASPSRFGLSHLIPTRLPTYY
ncbi:MAG: hypothetical protein INR71_15085, partial [Terriglobus roseus]|nr:hypothetical protein [Terriglobus roseus]